MVMILVEGWVWLADLPGKRNSLRLISRAIGELLA